MKQEKRPRTASMGLENSLTKNGFEIARQPEELPFPRYNSTLFLLGTLSLLYLAIQLITRIFP